MQEAFDYLTRTFGVSVRNILNIGAHEGQERNIFKKYCLGKVVFVEAIPAVYQRLSKNIEGYTNFHAVNAVCADQDNKIVNFNIASNEESSSLLDFSKHKEFYPNIKFNSTLEMKAITVDTLISNKFPDTKFNVLVLDTQGAELMVLRGALNSISEVDAIYTEVSETPLYEGSCTLIDLIKFLEPRGFGLKWLKINPHMFGDGLFVRNDLKTRSAPIIETSGRNIAIGKPAKQSSLSAYSKPNDACGAVSGVRTGRFNFCTELEDNPWWEVDLGALHEIFEILIFNRIDVAAYRASKLKIYISNDGDTWSLVHDQAGRTFGGADGHPLRVRLNKTPARIVRLQLEGREYFHLDQVEIYSTDQ